MYSFLGIFSSKASDCCKEGGDLEECADLLQKAAYAWGMYGDTSKTADTYIKAAKTLESSIPEKAKALYDKGCDMAFPANTPAERIPQLHPGSIEMFRDKFNFLLKQSMYADALAHAPRMTALTGNSEESAICQQLGNGGIALKFTKMGTKAIHGDPQFLHSRTMLLMRK